MVCIKVANGACLKIMSLVLQLTSAVCFHTLKTAVDRQSFFVKKLSVVQKETPRSYHSVSKTTLMCIKMFTENYYIHDVGKIELYGMVQM